MKGSGFMRLIKKDSLYTLTELSADKIIKMNDDELRSYQETLANSVNLFPIQKERLEDAFKKMDYAPTLQWLKSMRNTLNQIHADNLVKQCDKQLVLFHDVDNIRHDRLKMYIDFFIPTAAMLYADIQMALDELAVTEKSGVKENYAKKVKERLSTITELNQAAIGRMTDDQLRGYVKSLITFHEDCPAQENGLRSSFKIKNYASVIRWLGVIEAALAQINADNLVEECRRQINLNNDYSAIRHEKMELFINYFLTSLSLLCADIGVLKLSEKT
jgi:hypothetical protein